MDVSMRRVSAIAAVLLICAELLGQEPPESSNSGAASKRWPSALSGIHAGESGATLLSSFGPPCMSPTIMANRRLRVSTLTPARVI